MTASHKVPTAGASTWRDRAVLAGSSALGLGYLPLAPGTWGTLGALPLWWAMADLPWPWFALITAVGVLGAIWVSGKAEAVYGAHDVGHIVIDEVVGLLCTVIGVPCRWPQVLAAFVVFRFLDTVKPPPIRFFDEKMPGGAGVVLDDVVAGLIGCGLLHGVRLYLGGWW